MYQTIGRTRPLGICGSGLIDSIYELKRNRIIGADGKFDRSRRHPRLTFEEGGPQYVIEHAPETESGEPIVFTEPNTANLIKSKGSIFAAIKSLIDYAGLSFDQLDTFYVAGGFRNYLNVQKAFVIGLLPDIPLKKVKFIGNSSLTGARLALTSKEALEKCLHVSRSMTNIELPNYSPYMDQYIDALSLPHTYRRLFPSIKG
jgi:uncharacterized 2Fe-2S/4Fe-4S cluster protein (DUF4445 family)